MPPKVYDLIEWQNSEKNIKTKMVQLKNISNCSFNDGHSLRCESYWFWSPHGKNEHVRVHSFSKAHLPLSIFSNSPLVLSPARVHICLTWIMMLYKIHRFVWVASFQSLTFHARFLWDFRARKVAPVKMQKHSQNVMIRGALVAQLVEPALHVQMLSGWRGMAG